MDKPRVPPNETYKDAGCACMMFIANVSAWLMVFLLAVAATIVWFTI